jgi:hypothetical protein
MRKNYVSVLLHKLDKAELERVNGSTFRTLVPYAEDGDIEVKITLPIISVSSYESHGITYSVEIVPCVKCGNDKQINEWVLYVYRETDNNSEIDEYTFCEGELSLAYSKMLEIMQETLPKTKTFACENCGNTKRFIFEGVASKHIDIYIEGEEAGIENPNVNIYCKVCGEYVTSFDAHQVFLSFDLTK